MDLIDFDKKILSKQINNFTDFSNLLTQITKISNFNVLEYYINLDKNSIKTINYILYLSKLTFKLDNNQKNKFKLNRLEISIILANSFLCLYKEKNNFSKMNFINLYKENKLIINNTNNYEEFCLQIAKNEINNGDYDDIFNLKIEKLKFIFNYFNQISKINIKNQLESYCIFEKNSINLDINKIICKSKLSKVNIYNNKKIEDSLNDDIKVDFANKYIGGGILNKGCVQEEILFLIHPELIVSCIIIEKLNDNEALFIYNVKRYSNYSGYGYDIKFLNLPNNLKQYNNFVAIDALNYKYINQYTKDNIDREIKKCYIGFNNNYNIISSGNWGCGAFFGNIELKFLIQLLSASLNNKQLDYYIINNCNKIQCIYNKIHHLNCNELYNYILTNYIK